MTKKTLVMTMVKDDQMFLKIWHDYYSGCFGAENCLVIDHGSQDRTELNQIESLGSQVIQLTETGCVLDGQNFQPKRPPGSFVRQTVADLRLKIRGEKYKMHHFDGFRFSIINQVKDYLLDQYDFVIVTDVDELILPSPSLHTDLPRYLEDNFSELAKFKAVGGIGIEVFHDISGEAEFDPQRPIFQQRENYYYRVHYSKPNILTDKVWISTHVANIPFVIDSNLLLVHLKLLDQKTCLETHHQRYEMFKDRRVGKRSRWAKVEDQARAWFASAGAKQFSSDTELAARFLKRNFKPAGGSYYRVGLGKRTSKLVPLRWDPSVKYKATGGLCLQELDEFESYRFKTDASWQRTGV